VESEPVQAILADLGGVEITKATTETRSFDDQSIDVVRLQTAVGEISYTTTADGREHAQFEFADLTASVRSALPDTYASMPDTDGLLTYDRGTVQFLRMATDAETELLASALDVPADDLLAFYNSVVGGFEAQFEQNDTTEVRYIPTPRRSLDGVSASDLAVRTPLTTENCFSYCFGCASSVSACGGCLLACASSAVGNLAGAVGCALCVTGSCGAGVPYSCYLCADNCA
jgi:hypothetical protein